MLTIIGVAQITSKVIRKCRKIYMLVFMLNSNE